jgi:type I restriction-modification system DNA methylase subunit
VLDGALEKFAANLPKPKAARLGFFVGDNKSVDEDLLAELDELRGELARSFKKHNPQLTGEDLTEATQRTIERLVFMRFLEDKLIEPEAIVGKLGALNSAWIDFVSQSKRLNTIYNDIIFMPHGIIDDADFVVNEKVFAGALSLLAHTNSPYDFNSLPVHILGSIYERFLGKVITTTDERARVEEKPEVRKAGGVYYTPAYIVRYIVENTVGKIIAGKSPEEIAKMRFADIACGSGSFLLGVFDELLRYHAAYYNEPANRDEALAPGKRTKRPACVENADGSLRLSLTKRKEILLNNIYGIDLDARAVEVAQLSLLLKLLEDETAASAKGRQLEIRETRLPSLDKNIKHGNSLINRDILDGRLFERDEERALCPVDFAQAFPEVMKRGGFDAIVGNPPYRAALTAPARKHLSKTFKIGTTDTAALMMLRALELTKPAARIGLIVPKSFTFSSTWENTRSTLLNEICVLVDVGKVWKEVKLEQVICIFDKTPSTRYQSLKRIDESFVGLGKVKKEDARHFNFYVNGLSCSEIDIGRKVLNAGVVLGNLTENKRGGMFQSLICESKEGIETKGIRAVGGKQLQRLCLVGQKGFVRRDEQLPPPAYVKPNSILVQNIVAHITNPTDRIKIIALILSPEEAQDIVILDTVNQLVNHSNQASTYLLALLHSKLINWYVYRFIYAKAIRTMHFDAPVSDKIPVRAIDFLNKSDKRRGDKIIHFTTQLSRTKKQFFEAETTREKNIYKRKCDALTEQINTVIYDLYGLTEAERALVESQA